MREPCSVLPLLRQLLSKVARLLVLVVAVTPDTLLDTRVERGHQAEEGNLQSMAGM